MSILRASLSVILCTTLAQPTVAWAGPPWVGIRSVPSLVGSGVWGAALT